MTEQECDSNGVPKIILENMENTATKLINFKGGKIQKRRRTILESKSIYPDRISQI